MRNPIGWAPRLTAAAILAFAAALAFAAVAAAKTTWLCRPGAAPDPCAPGLSTTVYSTSLKPIAVTHPRAVKNPPVDCFYVYPTISDQKTEHANLHIDPEEKSIALYQAARYSQYCRVFAPMYRQDTIPYLEKSAGEAAASLVLPLSDLRSAFKDFLEHYSRGRGFVLIGHSQGSFLLRELVAKDIDPKPAVRKHLLSAILLGGDVLVKRGSDVGGDFKHVRACHTATQLSCVIAWSTFNAPPPPNSFFGRSPNKNDTVLCTDPAELSRSGGLLDPIFPSKPFAPGTLISQGIALLGFTLPSPPTVWGSEPGGFSAHCFSAGGADVLEVTSRGGTPTPHPSPTPQWGLHLMDANVALGNLIAVVHTESLAYTAHHRGRP